MENDAAVTPSVYDTVVSLLNEASSSSDANNKLECLKKVQELIVYRDANLLDNFLDEVLGFQHDTSPEIRKFLLSFTELACKRDPEILTKVVANLGFFFADENINVRKKVIVAMTSIYPVALKWVAKMRNITNAIEQTWEYLVQLKNRLIPLLDDDNEGIRTYIIKLIEACILSESCKTASSQSPSGNEEYTVSLDQIPRDHRLISYRKLEAEGKALFQKILDMLSSPHVSSLNLITCMAALSNIARQRPDFMERVILSFETLHVNLPPTLAKSQVSSVRKALKQHLLALLKHPASIPYQPQMTTLLTDLGVTQLQVIKALPPGSELRKRIRRAEDDLAVGENDSANASSVAEKARLPGVDDDMDDGHLEANAGEMLNDDGVDSDERRRNSAVDATAEYLYKKLTPQNVADLVLLSVIVLPDQIPPQFQSSFTPISAAGTEAQIRHLSHLMATQFTALGLGPGAEQEAKQIQQQQQEQQQKAAQRADKKKEEQKAQPTQMVSNAALTPAQLDEASTQKKLPLAPLVPAGSQPGIKTSKRFHQFGLAHITKPMDPETNQRMMSKAFERILNAEMVNGGASMTHMKILIAIVSEFNNPQLTESLQSFIIADQKSRADLAILWIYYEYCCFQKYVETITMLEDKAFEKYDRCLSSILTNLLARGEHKETLFHKIFLEAPLITPNSLEVLKQACFDPVHGFLCLITLREMIITRPKQRDEILCALIDFTCFEKADLRHQSLEIAKELYKSPNTKLNVYKYVVSFLQSLLEPVPPNSLFGIHRGRLENPGKWEEDSIKACLYLYLYLLPVDYSLIHQLAEVYVSTSNETKRIILRLIESPIKAAGSQCPELMSLIENFPPGAETLVTKVVNLLTERSIAWQLYILQNKTHNIKPAAFKSAKALSRSYPPTLDLVRRVRNLYHERVPDVRFLIPVLSGLQKREIIAALPKLIRLNTNVVKEVFNRLLHGKNLETGQQSLSPAELMLALGKMEFSSTDDAKPIISALNMLMTDSAVYTKDVIATAVQHLSECNPLPALLMRIIIQSLSFYPGLVGFVMNILQRLIAKQVWKQPKVWEGFIKCCAKTRPQSFQVLMQLPAPQLINMFENNPDLKLSMKNHIASLSTTHQAYHIPSNVRKALYSEESNNQENETVSQSSASEVVSVLTSQVSAIPAPLLNIVKTEND